MYDNIVEWYAEFVKKIATQDEQNAPVTEFEILITNQQKPKLKIPEAMRQHNINELKNFLPESALEKYKAGGLILKMRLVQKKNDENFLQPKAE